jgi:hypothetical protein
MAICSSSYLYHVGKIKIGKFVQIGTYMCVSVRQLGGLYMSINNPSYCLQAVPVVSALTVIDRTNEAAYTDGH